MKIVSLLAGVAAVALTASVASAQDIRVGQYTNGLNAGHISAPGDTSPNNIAETNLIRSMARDGSQTRSAWFAEGNAVNNIGSEANSDGASFTMTGTVSTDCAYYSGDNNTENLDFGQIGIYASDNTGPAAAFTMVDDAEVTIDTNLAGCNTANTVRIQKTDLNGLVNAGASAYDSNVFQANLPYSVTARYTASPATGGAAAGSAQILTVATTSDQASRQHGAWKSAMALDVTIPVPAKALVAGSYAGTFGVTISAGL